MEVVPACMQTRGLVSRCDDRGCSNANHDNNGNDGGRARSTESGRAALGFRLVEDQLSGFSQG